MRELIGLPQRVLYAATRKSGLFISAAFDYGAFVCHFETGIDAVARFDAHLEVYSDDMIVRVDYDTPYIRHLPTVLSVTEPNTGFGVSETRGYPTRGDAFVVEWSRFHHNITERRTSKSSIADARKDLEDLPRHDGGDAMSRRAAAWQIEQAMTPKGGTGNVHR